MHSKVNIRRLFHFLFGYPFSTKAKTRQFFIVGSGRSGTTLLRRILLCSHEIHVPPENQMLGRAIVAYKKSRMKPWRFIVESTLRILEDHSEFKHFKFDSSALVDNLIDAPFRQRSLSLIIDQLYVYHSRLKGRKIEMWGDKTPVNSYCLEDIRRVFPEAKFIHIIRDGCDVVESYIRSGLYADIRTAAYRWLTSTYRCRMFCTRYGDNSIEVRYEDLVNLPERTIKEICLFLRIDFTQAMLHSEKMYSYLDDAVENPHYHKLARPLTNRNIGLGRRNMSSKQMKQLGLLINTRLRELGYDAL